MTGDRAAKPVQTRRPMWMGPVEMRPDIGKGVEKVEPPLFDDQMAGLLRQESSKLLPQCWRLSTRIRYDREKKARVNGP